MATLKLVIDNKNDDTLHRVCRPVGEITPRVGQLLDDMIETMRKHNGCGLAAPQVGILRRIAVVEVEEGTVYELINPRIVAYTGEQIDKEGCLSLPGKWGNTRRPMAVTVRALDRDGNEVEYRGEGLLARAFCHEIDHLDGKLFTEVVVGELENN